MMAEFRIPRALIEDAVRDIVAEALVAERDRANRMAAALDSVQKMLDDGHPNDPDWFRIIAQHNIALLLDEHADARPTWDESL